MKGRFHGAKHSVMSPNTQFARIVETVSYESANQNSPYVQSVTANQFDRVVNLMSNYRYYRIVDVAVEFRPLQNFAQVGISGENLTNFFSIMNTNGLEPTYFNPAWLRSQGAKPRLFNKPITIKYKPKILIEGVNGVDNTATGTVSKSALTWLPTYRNGLPTTINSDIEYWGLMYEFENTIYPHLTSTVAEVFITVVAEFKEPYDPLPANPGDGVAVVNIGRV